MHIFPQQHVQWYSIQPIRRPQKILALGVHVVMCKLTDGITLLKLSVSIKYSMSDQYQIYIDRMMLTLGWCMFHLSPKILLFQLLLCHQKSNLSLTISLQKITLIFFHTHAKKCTRNVSVGEKNVSVGHKCLYYIQCFDPI